MLKKEMAENHNPNKRHSSSSTLSLSTRTAKIKEFTRADKRNKSSRPFESISEIAINNLGKDQQNDSAKQIKRFYSTSECENSTSEQKVNCHRFKGNPNQNHISTKQYIDAGKISMDYYQQQHPSSQPPATTTIHYGSPNLSASPQPTVHYISGHVNQAFIGGPMHNHNQYPQDHNMMAVDRVHREQYWSWPCCQQRWNWTRREKTLSLIIVGQSFIIFGLLVALFIIVFTDDDITLCKPDILEPPWKLN